MHASLNVFKQSNKTGLNTLMLYTYGRTDIHRAVLFIRIYVYYLYSNFDSDFCCLKSNVRMERDCVHEAISPSLPYKLYLCSMYVHTYIIATAYTSGGMHFISLINCMAHN